MSRDINQIIDDFIGDLAEYETNTGSFVKEEEYIKWLVANTFGSDFSDEDVDSLYNEYIKGYRVEEFLDDYSFTNDDKSTFYHLQYQDNKSKFDNIVKEDSLFDTSSDFYKQIYFDELHNKDLKLSTANRFLDNYMKRSILYAGDYNALDAGSGLMEDLQSFIDAIPKHCFELPFSKLLSATWINKKGEGGFVIDKDIQSVFKEMIHRFSPDAVINIVQIPEKEAKKYLERMDYPSNSFGR